MTDGFEDAYELMKAGSINRNEVQATQRKAVYRKKKKRYRLANPKKFFVAILLAAALFLGGRFAYSGLEPYFDGSYVNQSYTVGYDAIGKSTHRTSDNQGYWYDVDAIASLYNSAEMDFDSYVFGAYSGMHMRAVPNMDDLFWQFKMMGITEYNKFTEYVKGSGYTKTVDGQEVADIDSWKDNMKKHIRVGNELTDAYAQYGTYNGAMDIDIYIHNMYENLGWNKESTLLCMDELLEDLYTGGYTPYSSFLDYCASKGFVKEKDGKMVVDQTAYLQGYRHYINNLEKLDEIQNEIDQFRNGIPVEEKTEGLGK